MMRSIESVRFGTLLGVLAACLLCLCLCGVGRAQTLPGGYNTSWIDNTFGGWPNCTEVGSGLNFAHVQDDIQALYVGSDGTCYTNCLWDEGLLNSGMYRAGAIVGSVDTNDETGGMAVTSDGTYVYVGQFMGGGSGGTNQNGQPKSPPNSSTNWYAVGRYWAFNGQPAPFNDGYGPFGNWLVVTTTNSPFAYHSSNNVVTGMTCFHGYLYVSDYSDGVVDVYTTSSLSQTPTSTYTAPNAGAVAADFWGTIWCLEYTGATYTRMGASLAQGPFPGLTGCSVVPLTTWIGNPSGTITFASGAHPVALAYNPASGLLMVADQGPDQNIKCYNPNSFSGSPTTPASTIGSTGGVYSGTTTQGQIGALRFNMPSGVGADSSGNVYVSEDGTPGAGASVLESYTSGGTQNWSIYGLSFMDGASLNLSSQNDYYTPSRHITMNWNNTTPGSEGTYAGYTVNPIAYPEDPRLHLSTQDTFVRTLGGKTILFTTTGYDLEYFRFSSTTNGQVAIPSGMFSQPSNTQTPPYTPDLSGWPENQPNAYEWMWRDANGNGLMDSSEYSYLPAGQQWWGVQATGWCVDSSGNVWESMVGAGTGSIREFPYGGLDSNGNPIYSYSTMVTYTPPTTGGILFNEIHRLEYFPSTDTMYIGGFTSSYPDPSFIWQSIGWVVYRFDNWCSSYTNQVNPPIHSGYPIVTPLSYPGTQNDPEGWESAMDIDASQNYLFAGSEFTNEIYVYNAGTGQQAGVITPSYDIGGCPSVASGASNCCGWLDTSYGMHVDLRSNGEYDITEEDDWANKIVLYRWIPSPSAVAAAPANVTAGGGSGSVSLTWSGSSGATSYNVYRGTTTGGEALLVSGLAYQYTTYTDTSVTNGTTYYYKVAAVNTKGTSSYSSEVSAKPVSTNLLLDPGFETNPANSWSVWTSPSGAYTWCSTVSHSGSYSLEFSATTPTTGCANSMSIPVTPGTWYTFGGWVETSNLGGGGNTEIALGFWDSNNYEVSGAALWGPTGTQGWTYVSGSVYMPLTVSTVQFLCLMNNATGTVYFDDMWLAPVGTPSPVAISCGGAGGETSYPFMADNSYSGGTAYPTNNTINTSQVFNAAPQSVYQNCRYGVFTYTIGNLTPNQDYIVRLHFAELGFTAPNQRQFNVSINSTSVLTNFDIVAAAGAANTAVVEQFSTTANSSGQVVIAFTTGAYNDPAVNGIEVVPATAVSCGGSATGIFAADYGYSGGITTSTTSAITMTGVTNPAPQSVYQHLRYATTAFTYTLGNLVAGRTYSVRLHFAELTYAAANKRQFNVFINGAQMLKNFDIFATAGAKNTAVVETFTAVANASGQVVISFTPGAYNNPQVNGIEITLQQEAISCGGPGIDAYMPDNSYSGGGTWQELETVWNTNNIISPAPELVYQDERGAPCSYTLCNLTPNQKYTVRLHWAEVAYYGPNQRQFNVLINGTQVLTNFDVYAAAGGPCTEIVKQFSATANSSGQIDLSFTNGAYASPFINGIEVVR